MHELHHFLIRPTQTHETKKTSYFLRLSLETCLATSQLKYASHAKRDTSTKSSCRKVSPCGDTLVCLCVTDRARQNRRACGDGCCSEESPAHRAASARRLLKHSSSVPRSFLQTLLQLNASDDQTSKSTKTSGRTLKVTHCCLSSEFDCIGCYKKN